ncbi:type II toxin-antitoxin system HicB family antitoxin [Jiella mangrovi]|uniref:Type II toxin-antitoxin system HicB family antitoxin n=1 Tax=Jiella mangrovi TaxID=2821407 RepID=A0ABS4BM69_9HYPH|nr:type II toxin-antitoxin system HicB family antitoxin [Jiella mangrovi]MBP0617255.1 type II toxin-antitoxin system HicB family antitoxin [Jiella mangrovi]
MTIMHHRGYEARIDFDEEAESFHGEVLNLRDVITFEGTSVEELKKAFIDSVEDYIAFCRERGEEPEKPFSGQFVVRAEPRLHRQLAVAAKRAGISLNKLVTGILEKEVAD